MRDNNMQHSETDNISEMTNPAASVDADEASIECCDLPCGKAAGRPRAADLESRMENLVTTAPLYLSKKAIRMSV